jgi:hypothetical protein
LPPAKGDYHYTLYSQTGKEKTGKTLPFNPFSANMALYSGKNRDDQPEERTSDKWRQERFGSF